MNSPRYPAATMVFTPGQSVIFHRGTAVVTLSNIDIPGTGTTLGVVGVFTSDVQVSHLELLAIRIELSTTSTAGNRTLSVRLETREVPDILYEIAIPNESLAPNQSRTWQLAPGVSETTVPPMLDVQEVNLPPLLHVNSDQRLVIEDSAGIDAQDDMIVHVMSRVYELRSL